MPTNEPQRVNTIISNNANKVFNYAMPTKEAGKCSIHGIDKISAPRPGGSVNDVQYKCLECQKEYEAEQAEEKRRQSEHQKYIMSIMGIPKHFRESRLSDFQKIGPVMKWIEDPTGFLFVYGGCGCGKSRLACALQYYNNTIQRKSELIFSTDIFLELKASFNDRETSEEDVIAEYSVSDLCIFDDMGASKISEYVIEAWYNILDHRYRNDCPTVITSNLSIKEISEAMNDRIASRLASGVVFKMEGGDRRLQP